MQIEIYKFSRKNHQQYVEFSVTVVFKAKTDFNLMFQSKPEVDYVFLVKTEKSHNQLLTEAMSLLEVKSLNEVISVKLSLEAMILCSVLLNL